MPDALTRDESTLDARLLAIDKRFDAAWPSRDKIGDMELRATAELIEVKRALETMPGRRAHVLEEIGDTMLALGRLALAIGAESPLDPMRYAARKTEARLLEFEHLVESPTAGDFERHHLWTLAKGLAAAKLADES
jgi:NTP pyrophosphatase (non-canonical NTP hydrolase)